MENLVLESSTQHHWTLQKIKETYQFIQPINNGLLYIKFKENNPRKMSERVIFEGGKKGKDSYKLISKDEGYFI